MSVIPIVYGASGTIPKYLEKRLDEQVFRVRIETIQTTALLRSTGILRKVLETGEDLL